MRTLWRKIIHEPVAFWVGGLTIADAVLGALGGMDKITAIIGAIVLVLGGAGVRQVVTPVATVTDPTNPQMSAP